MLREPYATLTAAKGKVLGAACGAQYAEQGGDVFRLGLGKATLIGSVKPGTTTFRTDAQFLYFGVYNAGGIYRLSRASSPGSAAVSLSVGNVFGFAADSAGVYWGEHANGSPSAGAIHKIFK